MARVRQNLSVRVQQLESQIQDKLDLANERREVLEREKKEKQREHVNDNSFSLIFKQIYSICKFHLHEIVKFN